jgi:putative DNA primase/helicase
MDIQSILNKLESVKSTGSNQWMAKCPCHKDDKPSLGLTVSPQGKLVVNCLAGCNWKNIYKALGLTAKPQNLPRTIETTYDYRDENGNLLFQSVRYKPKDFRQRRPNGKGGWINNLKGVGLILYRLPDLIKSNNNDFIFIVEGEKDADRLVSFGLIATTNPMGALKWRSQYNEALKGRKVVIIPDNDEPGQKHAQQVASSLFGTAAEIKIIALPGTSNKDVSAWFDSDKTNTAEKLVEIVKATPLYIPQINTGQPTQTIYPLTDAGNAERFADMQRGKIINIAEQGRWLGWDGYRFNATIGDEMARRLAIETVRAIPEEAKAVSDGSEREKIFAWAIQSESRLRIEAMLQLTKYLPPIVVHTNELDKNPMLFNCIAGTIDLQTGVLRKHNSTDLITKLSPIKIFDLNAKNAVWDSFLASSTQNSPELLNFLQDVVGYSLTGRTDEEKLFFVHGPEAAGKSTFLEAIKATFGDYAQTADFETFLKREQVGGARNDIASLSGARAIISIEVDEGKKLAEGLVKTLTGGDTVKARFLYKEAFEFVPQFKLFLAANDAPHIKDTDSAMWRRVLRIPFENTVPVDKRNPKIKATLRNPDIAGPVIFAWAVKGCLRWQKEGLKIPDIVRQSTEAYRESQDPICEFLDEACLIDTMAFVPVSDMRKAYEAWAKNTGLKYPLGPREFNKRLEAKKCVRKTKRFFKDNGFETAKVWVGITLNETPFYDENCTEDVENLTEKQGNLLSVSDEIPI